MVLDLASEQWAELEHAYGSAADIPRFLAQLDQLPASNGDDEPWFSLWSALAHQGDVFSASFAAVPHIVAALSRDPVNADPCFLQFPAWVEICRAKSSREIPTELREDYLNALAQLPKLVAARAAREWDSEDVQVALAAIAAAKGAPQVSEAALELSPDVAASFLNWFFEQ